MIFSDFYKSTRSPLSRRKHGQSAHQRHEATAPPGWDTEDYADLLSKDKSKQKAAIKRYLSTHVKGDWEFSALQQAVASTGSVPQDADSSQKQLGIDAGVQEAQQQVQDELQDPKDGYQADSGEEDERLVDTNDADSVYSVTTEDADHYRPRLEWTSDLSDSDNDSAPQSSSPFRLYTPIATSTDTDATAAKKELRRAQRRKELREEMKSNPGLACFEARRNAWTGARTVRVRPRDHAAQAGMSGAPAPSSPLSTKSRRHFFRQSFSSGSPPKGQQAQPANGLHRAQDSETSSKKSCHSLAKENESSSASTVPSKVAAVLPPNNTVQDQTWPVQDLVPLPPPLLPPQSTLRASISPNVYFSLYDKLVVQNLTPSCPVNLKDMLRACVAGWQRDGEWPPKPTTMMDAGFTIRRRRSSAQRKAAEKKNQKDASAGADGHGESTVRRLSLGLLGKDKEKTGGDGDEKKRIRRSLQKVLGFGPNAEAA